MKSQRRWSKNLFICLIITVIVITGFICAFQIIILKNSETIFAQNSYDVIDTEAALIENSKLQEQEVKNSIGEKQTRSEMNLLANGASGMIEQNGVYYIYDLEGLKVFRDSVNAGNTYSGKTIHLMNDIDISERKNRKCKNFLGTNWNNNYEALCRILQWKLSYN